MNIHEATSLVGAHRTAERRLAELRYYVAEWETPSDNRRHEADPHISAVGTNGPFVQISRSLALAQFRAEIAMLEQQQSEIEQRFAPV